MGSVFRFSPAVCSGKQQRIPAISMADCCCCLEEAWSAFIAERHTAFHLVPQFPF